jgi:hypothetical protein
MSVDSRYHRRGIDGRVRDAKSTADTESGSERSAEKNRRVDRPRNGPEGTYLEIPKGGDTYEIRIKDLDKVQTYRGTATSDGISFKRNGKAETIRSGKCERTGMKWLADKKDCLLIRRILPGLIGSLQLI